LADAGFADWTLKLSFTQVPCLRFFTPTAVTW
jgi:hypothetical protein